MEKEINYSAGRKPGRKELFILAALFAAAAVLLGIVTVNRGLLLQKPVYVLESTSEVSFGKNGTTLVIDNGKKNLLVLDADGRLKQLYTGGSKNRPFYYACHAAQTSDGSIYVADITYGAHGNLLEYERIIRLKGGAGEVLYEVDYTGMDEEDIPLQYGRIVELQEYEDEIYFTEDYGSSIEVKKLRQDGTVSTVASVPSTVSRTDVSFDVETGILAVIERTGDICLIEPLSGDQSLAVQGQGAIPFDIAVRNKEVYYTDLTEMTVRHFPIEKPGSNRIFYQSESVLYKLDVSMDGTDVIATDYAGFLHLPGNDAHECAENEYVDSASFSKFHFVILLWVVLMIGCVAALLFIVRMLFWVIVTASANENAMRVLIIVITCLAVFFILSYMLLSRILKADTTSSEKQTGLFAEMLLQEIDGDLLKDMDSPSDYDSEEYSGLKAALDEHIRKYYEQGDYYYYIIYRALDGKIVYIMDFEDTMPVTYPVYEDDPQDNDYAFVIHEGENILTSEISSYGSWSFILTPILDSHGTIVAELEVGQNLDFIKNNQQELRLELMISAAVSTVVLTMLFLEIIFLIDFFENRRKGRRAAVSSPVPVRTLMFTTYLADSMQDAFIAILCSQLYKGGLPVPESVAIALPMSGQLLMMAVFSFLAGRLTERFGSKKIITSGMLLQLAGFLCCFTGANYPAILLGKLFIGAGMGLIYVGCNTVAAAEKNSEAAAAAFAGISAGTLSGLTIGAGLSSVLLSLGGWRLIYLAGAVIVGLGVLLAASSTDVRPAAMAGEAPAPDRKGFRKFFFTRRTLGFFILILLPFMMSLSYREYFFPLFAQDKGITEVRIGQIYLACGLIMIYAGPYLAETMLRVFGALWSIILASTAMGLDMLLFVFHPGLTSVMIGVVLLSVIISFAYTCQYTYFELTPESVEYGAGKSMGIYSVFESLGQTIGPVAYGALLSFGYRRGIGIFSVVMLVLTMIFLLLTAKNRKLYREAAGREQ